MVTGSSDAEPHGAPDGSVYGCTVNVNGTAANSLMMEKTAVVKATKI